MMNDISIEQADQMIQKLDYTGEGIISFMNRNEKKMTVNIEYYSHQHTQKEITSKGETSDPFCLILWNLFKQYQTVNSIAIVRPYYTMLWATVGRSIPPLNAYFAEHFSREIACTERTPEPYSDFVKHQTNLLTQTIGKKEIMDSPAVLMRGFGAVVFGASMEETLKNTELLEKNAEIAWKVFNSTTNLAYMDYSELMTFRSLYNGTENLLNKKPETIGDHYQL